MTEGGVAEKSVVPILSEGLKLLFVAKELKGSTRTWSFVTGVVEGKLESDDVSDPELLELMYEVVVVVVVVGEEKIVISAVVEDVDLSFVPERVEGGVAKLLGSVQVF